MKNAMAAHAQLFPKDIQPQEVINFYQQKNLQQNGHLAEQAYLEALKKLGFQGFIDEI